MAAMAFGSVIIVSVDETKLVKQLIGVGGMYNWNNHRFIDRLQFYMQVLHGAIWNKYSPPGTCIII